MFRISMMHGMLKQRHMHFTFPTCLMHTLVKQKQKVSSVDARHFTPRMSLHTTLKEREDLPLRDTKCFAFHQHLVC